MRRLLYLTLSRTSLDIIQVIRRHLSTTLTCRSIGYKSVQAEASLPFDAKEGFVPNEGGRVEPGEVLLLFLLFISFICQ